MPQKHVTGASAPLRTSFTLRLDADLVRQVDAERRSGLASELGIKLSRNDFFARLASEWLKGRPKTRVRRAA